MYNRPNQLLAQLSPRYDFYERKNKNTYVQPACPAASIATPTLRFLQAKKRKKVYLTDLTNC